MRRSPSPATSSGSSYQDDSSDIDELDNRSRELNRLLRKNANMADARKKLLNVVKDKAWILEDQVEILEKQTKNVKQALKRKSFLRRLVMFGALISSVVLIGLGINHVAHSSDEDHH